MFCEALLTVYKTTSSHNSEEHSTAVRACHVCFTEEVLAAFGGGASE
jgi:hypothetical protein